MAWEECEEGPEERKEVQETKMRARRDSPQARFSWEKMVAREKEDE